MSKIEIIRRGVRHSKRKSDDLLYELGLLELNNAIDPISPLIKSKCHSCSKDIFRDFGKISGRARKYILDTMKNGEEYNAYCSISCANKNQKEYKECSSCGKIALHYKRSICMDCYNKSDKMLEASKLSNELQWKFNKISTCISCEKESEVNKYGLCKNCRLDGLGASYRYCDKCLEITIHNGYKCFKCNPETSKNFGLRKRFCKCCNDFTMHSGQSCFKCLGVVSTTEFNREEFYKDKFLNTKISFNEKPVSLDSTEIYAGIPGVWAVFGEESPGYEIFLDVCQTKDIGSEMLGWIRQANACKDKTDEELIELNEKHMSYNRFKKRDIMNHDKISFKIVALDVAEFNEREKVELDYACQSKSKFWSPAPGQLARVSAWVG